MARVIYYLDFRICDLYGWENRKSKLMVASIAEQILLGAQLPLVKVFQRNRDTFELPSEEGGHHRALAHMILKRSLPCLLTDKEPEECSFLNIRDIQLVDDINAPYYDRFDFRRSRDPNYVPFSNNNPLIARLLGLDT